MYISAEERFCSGIYWNNEERDWKVFSKGKFNRYTRNNDNSIMDGYVGIVAVIEIDGHLKMAPVEKIKFTPIITITISADEDVRDSQIHKFISDAKESINSLGNKAFKIKNVTIH